MTFKKNIKKNIVNRKQIEIQSKKEKKIIEEFSNLFNNILDDANWYKIYEQNLKDYSLSLFKNCIIEEFKNKKQEIKYNIYSKFKRMFIYNNNKYFIILEKYYNVLYNNIEIIKKNKNLYLTNYLNYLKYKLIRNINILIELFIIEIDKYFSNNELNKFIPTESITFKVFINSLQIHFYRFIREYLSLIFYENHKTNLEMSLILLTKFYD